MWFKRLEELKEVDNFVLTASLGGRHDELATLYGMRPVKVVYTEKEAADHFLPIDHTDECAANPAFRDKPFALMIHGQQAKGSKASKAMSKLKKEGVQHSYS